MQTRSVKCETADDTMQYYSDVDEDMRLKELSVRSPAHLSRPLPFPFTSCSRSPMLAV